MRLSHTLIPVALGLAMAIHPAPASAQIGIGVGIGGVGISVGIAPPALPVYVQPPIPEPGFLWNPGYWAWNGTGYYWVPGTWVRPPRIGVLWTPPWWGFAGGFYGFHAGYWGPHVGFYGGINYGFGYGAGGFVGGRWAGGAFQYNSSVNNFGGTHITNVYNEPVANANGSRAAFNGPNGVTAQATPEQQAAEHEEHVPPTQEQTQHVTQAQANPQLRASANHGNPAIAATSRPGEFKGPGVVAANRATQQARQQAAQSRRAANAAQAGERRAQAQSDRNAARAQRSAQQANRAQQQARRPAAQPAQRPAEERR